MDSRRVSGRSIKLRYPDGTFICTIRQDFKRIDPNSTHPVCLRLNMPYGVFTCADGRDVLFNRDYTPLLQRINGVVTAADSDEWVPWVLQRFFYDDADPPWANAATRARCVAVLAEWQGGPKADAPWCYGVALLDSASGLTTTIIPRNEPRWRRVGAR